MRSRQAVGDVAIARARSRIEAAVLHQQPAVHGGLHRRHLHTQCTHALRERARARARELESERERPRFCTLCTRPARETPPSACPSRDPGRPPRATATAAPSASPHAWLRAASSPYEPRTGREHGAHCAWRSRCVRVGKRVNAQRLAGETFHFDDFLIFFNFFQCFAGSSGFQTTDVSLSPSAHSVKMPKTEH